MQKRPLLALGACMAYYTERELFLYTFIKIPGQQFLTLCNVISAVQ
jgi:hypothetical protein